MMMITVCKNNITEWVIKIILKRYMSARKTGSTSFSKMEASFIASSTLKRNRRYLDIEKINLEEEH